MASDKFCLRWNDFESNISVAFRELREDKDFFDITLACEEEQIQAHKVILAACSPFFRSVLKRNPHSNPLVYLRGVKYSDLIAVLNFMYHGEVNVAQEELNSFLAVAEDLKVKGLTQNNPSSNKQPVPFPSPTSRPHKAAPRASEREVVGAPPKRPRGPQAPTHPTFPTEDHGGSGGGEEVQEVLPGGGQVKCEPGSQAITPLVEMGYEEEGFEEYSQEYGAEGQLQGYDAGVLATGGEANKGFDAALVGSYDDLMLYVVKTTGGYACCCGSFKHQWKMNVQNHVESIHFPGLFKWNCDVCGEEAKTRNILAKHKSKFHPKNPSQNQSKNLVRLPGSDFSLF